jgi:hypothetical protein
VQSRFAAPVYVVSFSWGVNARPHPAGEGVPRRTGRIGHLGDHPARRLVGRSPRLPGRPESGGRIVDGLLSIEPQEKFVERALIALAAPDGRVVNIKIEDGKAYLSDRHGEVCGEAVDLGAERSRMYADTTSWMILGQFARLPTAIVGDDSQRMDASVLFTIGQCPFPLLRANEEGLGHLEHDLDDLGRVLCQDQGPIEAATQAMADLLSRPWADANAARAVMAICCGAQCMITNPASSVVLGYDFPGCKPGADATALR